MAVRPVFNKEREIQFNDRTERYLGRIYVFWLLGVFVGTLKLRPEKYSVGGVEFSITQPDALQGVIFLGCLATYLALVSMGIRFGFEYNYSTLHINRRIIYMSLGRKRTLRGLSSAKLYAIKKVARGLFLVAAVVTLGIFFLPFVHILMYQRDALWVALKALFM